MGKVKWTFEACKEEALKYTTKKDFIKYSASAYGVSCSKGWLKDIDGHLEQGGNRFKRHVYAYEFSDKCVYVGLTYKISKRRRAHNKEGAVFEHMKNTNLNPLFRQLTERAVSPEQAVILEGESLSKYVREGWTALNIAKTGSLGGDVVKWTFEKCLEKAKLYSTRTTFCRAEGSAYSACLRNKWLDEVCKHMSMIRKHGSYWNYERCKEEALKYTIKKDFNKNCPGGYDKACALGWINDICSHMTVIKKPNDYYTYDVCKKIVENYTDFNKFRKENTVAYSKILLNSWGDTLYKNLYFSKKTMGYWSFDKCMEAARTCRTSKEFKQKFSTAYNTVCKNRWCKQLNENYIK